MRFTTSFALFAVALGLFGCVQPQQSTRQRGPATLVDEYSVLDDPHRGTVLSDQQIQKKLEEARRHYLMAMRSSDRGNQTLASRHFEAAIAILNDLITYPDIYSNPEFSKLSESLIRDYEEQVTSIDSLDPDGSFFVLRDKIMQEIETIPVAGRRLPGKSKSKHGARTASFDLTIDLTDNTPVQQSISYFTTEKGRKYFTGWLERTGRYFPMYEEILAEEGVPLELRHLSMIESGLKPTAVSWASAVGLWQFIPGTGREYGLQINWWVDERRDPVKATRAAARYLANLYKEMGDWHLALASYNCGPGRVRSAIAKAGSRDYWKVRQFLPRETQQYVPLFIAASKITMDPEAYGFNNINYEEPENFQTQSIPGSFDLATLARVAETTVDELKALNPELLHERTPEVAGGYQLRLPVGAPRDMAAKLDAIEVPVETESIWVTHRVGKGESFTGIARKYNVTVAEIYEANSLSPKTKLKSGMSLKIPIDPRSTGSSDTTTLADAEEDSESNSTSSAKPVPVATTPAPVAATPAPVAAIPAPTAPVTQPTAPATEPEDIFANAPPLEAPTAPAVASTPAPAPVETPAPIVSTPRREPSTGVATAPSRPVAETPRPVEEPKRETRNSVARREEPARPTNKIHVVASGESLTSIAKRYGVSVSDLAGWNNLSRTTEVQRGQKLKITPGVRVTETPTMSQNRGRNDESSSKKKRPVTTTTSRYETHNVRSGQSLIAIAEQYGVSVEDLKAWNPKGVRGNNVLAGARLRIYSEAPSKGDARRSSRNSKSTTPKKYKVGRGDTLEGIAGRFGVSVAELRKNNPDIKKSKLQAGQTLRIQK
jgi:membrane-bound lytic murein transglycosylase D